MKLPLTSLTILFFFFVSSHIYSQNSCFADDLIMFSQDVATNFAENYPDCTIIEGDVILWNTTNFIGMEQITEIQGVIRCTDVGCTTTFENFLGLENVVSLGGIEIEDVDITFEGLNSLSLISGSIELIDCTFPSFESLTNLTEIPGGIYMQGTSFESFLGLESLVSVGGIEIENADFTFDGLNALEVVSGSLKMVDCTFPNFESLANLTEIQGEFYMEETNFESFFGLQNLTSAQAGFINLYNDSLMNCDYLESLEYAGYLMFRDCGVLEGFEGLSNLESTGDLIVGECPLINSLNGFENLVEVPGNIDLWDNAILTDVSALSNVSPDVYWIYIGENPNLAECSLPNICQHLAIQDPNQSDSEFWDNAAGCNSLEEVIKGCGFSGINEEPVIPFQIINTTPSEILKIKNPTQQSFSIYNSLGNLLLQSNENSQVDVSHLPGGLYILTVHSLSRSHRFIVQ